MIVNMKTNIKMNIKMNINKIRKWTMTQTCTGWGDQSLDKLHFLMYRPSRLIEAYTVPEKNWLVSIELLAVSIQ